MLKIYYFKNFLFNKYSEFTINKFKIKKLTVFLTFNLTYMNRKVSLEMKRINFFYIYEFNEIIHMISCGYIAKLLYFFVAFSFIEFSVLEIVS